MRSHASFNFKPCDLVFQTVKPSNSCPHHDAHCLILLGERTCWGGGGGGKDMHYQALSGIKPNSHGGTSCHDTHALPCMNHDVSFWGSVLSALHKTIHFFFWVWKYDLAIYLSQDGSWTIFERIIFDCISYRIYLYGTTRQFRLLCIRQKKCITNLFNL